MCRFLLFFFFLMIRRPPRSTRTDTLVPYTTLFRSRHSAHRPSLYESTNALLAPYSDMYGDGWNAAIEATLISPPCWHASMAGTKACVRSTSAQQFNAIMHLARSEDRLVGKQCSSKCRARWSQDQ